MLFKPELAEKVLAGEKTQTRRLQQFGDVAIYDENGLILAVYGVGHAGRRLRYAMGNTYAVQPGRGKPAVGRVVLNDIRDECVQGISEADARAEGVELANDHRGYPSGQAAWVRTYRAGFARVWDAINGRNPEHRWEANPKVWALTLQVTSISRPGCFQINIVE